MRVVTLGDGTPDVAVVGGIHGDEPCGWRAVQSLISAAPDVERPLKLVLANERARNQNRRYVDGDLNRSFPSRLDDDDFEYRDDYEGHLARRLIDHLQDCLVLGLHSTQSHPEPFAIVSDPTDRICDVLTRLPIEAVVESGRFTAGRLIGPLETIEIECGYQGSEAATANAHAVTDAFLRATGVLQNPLPVREVPYYRLFDRIPKADATDYEVFADNFREVDPGEPYAATNGRAHYANDPFVPVLMSPEGYDEVFGYAATRIGSLP